MIQILQSPYLQKKKSYSFIILNHSFYYLRAIYKTLALGQIEQL